MSYLAALSPEHRAAVTSIPGEAKRHATRAEARATAEAVGPIPGHHWREEAHPTLGWLAALDHNTGWPVGFAR